MGREFELKYRADDAALESVAGAFGPFAPVQMETVYYDTQEGTLSALRWTLRCRKENGVSVCTVKTPAPGGGRGEWETCCDDIRKAIPELVALGAPDLLEDLTAQMLVPTCGAKFTRLAAVCEIPGATVELALDRGVLLGGGRQLPFAEVEVELKSGEEAAVVAWAQELAARFGLEPERWSKVQRAMALTKMED